MNQKRKIRKQMKEVTNKKEQKEMVDMQRILSQHINQREKDIQGGRRKNNIQTIINNGGVSHGGFWKVKKQMKKRKEEPACAVKTAKGVMVNSTAEIKEYKKFYKELLTNREIDQEVEKGVETTFEQILRIAELEEIEEVDKETIDKTIKSFKKKKASDTQG